MSEEAAYLVDMVLFESRYRQWTFAFPWPHLDRNTEVLRRAGDRVAAVRVALWKRAPPGAVGPLARSRGYRGRIPLQVGQVEGCKAQFPQ